MILVPRLPEMSATANKHLDAIASIAEGALERGADVMACMVAADDAAATPVAFTYGPSAPFRAVQTEIVATLIRVLHHPSEVLWAADFHADLSASDPTVPPSQNPVAIEALVIMYANTQSGWLAVLPYGRGDDGRVIWRKPLDWAAPDELWGPMSSAVLMAVQGPEPSPEVAAALLEASGLPPPGRTPNGIGAPPAAEGMDAVRRLHATRPDEPPGMGL